MPIPGTKRRKYLEENIKAAEVILDESIQQELGNLLNNLSVAGPRYEEKMMSLIDR